MGLFSPTKKKNVLRPPVLKNSQSVPNLNLKMNRDAAGSSNEIKTAAEDEKKIIMSDSASDTQNESESIQCGLDRYTLVVNKNKRKRTVTSENQNVPTSKKQLTSEFKIITKNKYECLPESEDQNSEKPKNEKPPPIYLREIIEKEFLQKLLSLAENQLYISPIKRGNINETKIQVLNIPHYRLVVGELDKLNKRFYTFQMKSSRGLKVVLKGIESNIDPTEIREDLESQGFKVKNVNNIVNSKKIPQPMFRFELEPESTKTVKGNHPIYNVNYVLYRRIQIEEPYKNRNPVQCFNCQEYGHTYNYCNLRQICVICSEAHDTKECPKDKNNVEVKKCSNCGENHTANYKGCLVYLELKQKLSSRMLGKKEQNKELQFSNPIALNKTSNVRSSNATYSAILTNKNQDKNQKKLLKETEESSPNVVKMIDSLNNTITKFIQSMETNMTMMLQLMNNLIQLQTNNQK